MKKILALVLALAMMLCMGTALATGDVEPSAAPAASTTVKLLDKDWTGETVNPTEALQMDVIESTMKNSVLEAVPEITLVKAADAKEFVLTHNITEVGNYFYLVKENAGNNTAGVTYDPNYYVVEIMIDYKLENLENNVPTTETQTTYRVSEAKVEFKDEEIASWTGSATKVDTITNEYADGEVTISKKVVGNLANANDEFTVKVTFTSDQPVTMPIALDGQTWVAATEWANGKVEKTLTVKAADADGYKITGIPAGVDVAVAETEKGTYDLVGYTVNGEKAEAVSITVADDSDDAVVITNEYKTNVETGINMDSMPYIVLMGLVVLAGVALILKKRTVND